VFARETKAASALLLLAGITLLLAGASGAATHDAEQFRYIGDALNQMNYLQAKSVSPKDHAREIIDQACKLLTQVKSDGKFTTLVLKNFRHMNNLEIRGIFPELGKVNELVDKETEALKGIGVDGLTSIEALAAASTAATKINADKIAPEDSMLLLHL